MRIKKFLVPLILILFIIISIPFIVNLLMLFSTSLSRGSSETWITFFGNYFGAIIGACIGGFIGGWVAYFIMKNQLRFEKEENRAKIKIHEQYERDKLIKDMQITTAELLQEELSPIISNLSGIHSIFNSLISSTYQWEESNTRINEAKEFEDSVNFWENLINDDNDKLKNEFDSLHTHIMHLTNIWLSRQLTVYAMADSFEVINKIYLSLSKSTLQLNTLIIYFNKSIENRQIDKELLEELLTHYNTTTLRFIYNLYIRIVGLSVDLQNTYFGELFNQNISHSAEEKAFLFDPIKYEKIVPESLYR